ncbi:hypothetical protein MNBD_BACTEROID01-2178 [hydrothermal vent metagenome]|uniref:Glycosyltransferase 2-like domain-containing protein n=1 Tax=hydrothermal vent metagenome TaxID=652676 RepID=A0A3B0UIX9_9ZZZZ
MNPGDHPDFFYIYKKVFAGKYIEKQKIVAIASPAMPPKSTSLIVVIPCFREPDILKTLDSLAECNHPNGKVEVIVLINHPEDALPQEVVFNKKTYEDVRYWHKVNHPFFTIPDIEPIPLPKKWAGAGLARKKGMDEAARRFNTLNKPDGLIVSLDADTLVDKNYFEEIEKHFQNNSTHIGATLAFRHQTEGVEPKLKEGITLYEKYLHYYRGALAYTGYPYALFTIGSAFVVTAGAYVKRGGMNRRKAGEDFYFLQNLTRQGTIGEIKTTCVYPSARVSDRVPFGTGPILQKWLDGTENLNLTYNFEAFARLKTLFDRKEGLYKISELNYNRLLKSLPEPVSEFLIHDGFYSQLSGLNKNCSTLLIFQKRFFELFNAFKILKFLNYSHEKFYRKEDLYKQNERLQNISSNNYMP